MENGKPLTDHGKDMLAELELHILLIIHDVNEVQSFQAFGE